MEHKPFNTPAEKFSHQGQTSDLSESLSLDQLHLEEFPADIWSAMKTLRRLQRKGRPLLSILQKENLPLSFAQERLWLLNQLMPNSSSFKVFLAFRLKGPLNVAVLEQSVNEIVKRHDALRTTFDELDGQPIQNINPVVTVKLPVATLGQFSKTEQEAQLERLVIEETQQPFDLKAGPLFRVALSKLDEQEHVFIVTAHLMVCDGASLGVFFRELSVLYNAFSNGKPSPLPPLLFHYQDFAVWQRDWLQGEVLDAHLAYWKKQLGGSLPILQFSPDRPSSAVPNLAGERQNVVFSKTLTKALKDLSHREGVTPFMTLLAAFLVLLYRLGEQDDIIVCTLFDKRDQVETLEMIGNFSNIVLLRTHLDSNPSFQELLSRVRQVVSGAYAYYNLPVQQLVENLNPKIPLHHIMFTLNHAPKQPLVLSGLTVSPVVYSWPRHFNLFLWLREEAEQLTGVLNYNPDLFESKTITRMIESFPPLLESLVANPEQHLDSLPLLTKTKLNQPLDQTSEELFVAPRDELELQLTKIWEKVLGIKSISMEDNFFYLGGDSLLAISLFNRIKKIIGKEMSLEILLRAPTIEKLANILRQEGGLGTGSSLVAIQSSGSKPPLFLIHPCTGEISMYRLLALHLGLDRPVYGLQAQGLDGKQLPYNRVEEMATHYIKEIQTIQPAGPYFLGGKDIGGLVAFEMAQKLVSQGQNVELVVFFGGFSGFSRRPSRRFSREWTSRQFENLLLFGPSYILKRVKEISHAEMMVTKSRLSATIHKFFPPSNGTFYPQIQQMVSLSISQARANYVPQIYSGRVAILQPLESYNGECQQLDQEDLIACRKLFAGDFEIHYVPGTDNITYTAYKEPYVGVLAEKLRVCIDKALTETNTETKGQRGQQSEILHLEKKSSLIPIQIDGSKRPFFCVSTAGAYGGSIGFGSLAQLLGPDQPFYALLQASMLDTFQPPPYRCLEELAAHYIEEIRVLQPHGPYFLGGRCTGGHIIFEMAKQLHEQGQKVALLAFFDSYAPNSPNLWSKTTFFSKVSDYHLSKLSSLEPKEKLTYIFERLKSRLNKISYKFFKFFSWNGNSIPQAFKYFHAEQVTGQIVKDYVPSIYQGRVVLFRSSYLTAHECDDDMGWSKLAAGGVDIHKLPGHFGDLFSAPQIPLLGEKLRACLNEAQRDI